MNGCQSLVHLVTEQVLNIQTQTAIVCLGNQNLAWLMTPTATNVSFSDDWISIECVDAVGGGNWSGTYPS